MTSAGHGKADKPTIAEQTTKVFRHTRGLHATYLMEIGIELGFFKRLADAKGSGLTAKALASRSKTDEWYTTVWCQTATAIELLDVIGGGDKDVRDEGIRYRLAPFIDELLANEMGRYYVGGSPHMHLQIARDYAKVPGFFLSGGSCPYQAHDRPFLLAAARGPKAHPRIFISTILPNMPDLKGALERGGSILDVGCGGGQALAEFATAFPKSSCLGVDIQPDLLSMARKLIRDKGLTRRASVRLVKPGQEFAPKGRFDLVTFFLVLHEVAPALKERVMRTAASALRPGGYLLVYDEAYPDTIEALRSEPELFAVIAQWYEGTWGNIINTRSEIKEIVSKAGLEIAHETNFSRYYVLTARKPQHPGDTPDVPSAGASRLRRAMPSR